MKFLKVITLADCLFEDWDEEKECPICPQCGSDYSNCECPGPHSEDIYDYKKIDGVLYAKLKKSK